MTRISIASDLKTRTGAPEGKDARLKNSYVEAKGDPQDPNRQTVVRKRPIAQGGISVGTGQAQGGIGFTIGSTPYFIGFWGDTMQTYTGSGTSWAAGTSYLTGAHASVGFVDYWAADDNVGNNPTSSPSHWVTRYVASTPRYTTTPSAGNVTVSVSETTSTVGSVFTRTRNYTIYRYGTSTLLSSGSGTEVNVSGAFGGGSPPASVTYTNLICTAAQITTIKNNWAVYGITISFPTGYDYYFLNGGIVYTYSGGVWSPTGGSGFGSPA